MVLKMQKKQFTIILAFALIFFSNFTTANAVDRSLVGVEVGDNFKLKIVANSFDPANIGIDFENYDINFGDLSLDEIGYTIEGFIPKLDEVIGVEVVTLPTNETAGEIELEYMNNKETLTTDFYIGTPVVFVDWEGWTTILNDVVANLTALDNVYSATLGRENNDTYFMNYIYLSIDIPDEEDQSLGIYQKMTYEKTTGFLEIMEIKLVIETDTPLGDIEQIFKVIRTDESITAEPESSDKSESTSDSFTPGFELISLISSIFLISKFKKRK